MGLGWAPGDANAACVLIATQGSSKLSAAEFSGEPLDFPETRLHSETITKGRT